MRIYFIICSVFIVNTIYSQRIISSCIAPDSILDKYEESAYYLAREYESAKNFDSFLDSINIPKAQKNKFRDAIIAVYNTTGTERDSIFIYKNINCFISFSLNEIYITCDTSLYWSKQLGQGNMNTGYQKLDSLLVYYHFTSVSRSNYYTNKVYHTLKSDSFYNMIPIAQLFNDLPEIDGASSNGQIGDGNDIYDSVGINTIDLAFSVGWGVDCVIGTCNYRKYWRYRVYDDCSVEFLGHYPMRKFQIINSINNYTNKTINIYPNPTSNILTIEGIDNIKSITIYDIVGNKVNKLEIYNNQVDVSTLSTGMYFIEIETYHGIFTKRFIKE